MKRKDFSFQSKQKGFLFQICSLVAEAIDEMNPHLKTLNVLAQVDKYAEIEYSMVESPLISNSSIDLGLKGEFYNIGHHQEPPFSPTPFSLPDQDTNMLYIALSAFTLNSAGFVYNSAGVMSLYITDDMIPSGFPIRLNTRTFGTFIPQIAKQFPGLMMKLLVKAVKEPDISFEPNNVTVQASSTITAYAIQPNATLSPVFILNVNASVSAQIYVSGLKVAGVLSLNEMNMALVTSYVGPFQVKSLDSVFNMILKVVVIPKVNAYLKQGYPLPSIGKMNLLNTQLQILKFRVDMVSVWCVLSLLTFLSLEASGTNPGVKIRITQKGLEYEREISIIPLQEKLKTIYIPDMSGKAEILFMDVSYTVRE
ncbi:hypothetical protein QTP86_002934 [Hemibagrus guttatus]|nr:hypothetical protein QTP86_002934 [Hemibagrus guttatus]